MIFVVNVVIVLTIVTVICDYDRDSGCSTVTAFVTVTVLIGCDLYFRLSCTPASFLTLVDLSLKEQNFIR